MSNTILVRARLRERLLSAKATLDGYKDVLKGRGPNDGEHFGPLVKTLDDLIVAILTGMASSSMLDTPAPGPALNVSPGTQLMRCVDECSVYLKTVAGPLVRDENRLSVYKCDYVNAAHTHLNALFYLVMDGILEQARRDLESLQDSVTQVLGAAELLAGMARS